MSDNNASYIKSLQAQIAAARAEIDVVKAEANFARAEGEALKAEAQALMAEAEALKVEAQALMAEAEEIKAEAEATKASAEAFKAAVESKAITAGRESSKTATQSSNTTRYSAPAAKPKSQIAQSSLQITGAVLISSIGENEKLPKERVVLYPNDYESLGITNFRATVFKDYDYDGYSMLTINGEYDGKTSAYLIIMPMVYNADGELIGADFDEIIKQKIRSHKTYSLRVKVPNYEQISRVEVRIVKDPVFLD